MDKNTVAIFGTAFVLIVLFLVYILIPKNSFFGKNNDVNMQNNNSQNLKETTNKIENEIVVDKIVPTELDLDSVVLKEIDEEITTEEILKVYEVSGPTSKVTFKLPDYRTIELSPDNRFVAMDTSYEERQYAFKLYDVVTGKFYNKILLSSQEEIEKNQGLYWWSGDAKYIAFTKADGLTQDLYIYDVYNDSYKKIETKSLLFCGDSCISEVPFWSLDSKYIAMVEHTRNEVGEYASTFVTIFDLNGNRLVQSEPIATGDTTTMFRLAFDTNNKVTYSYLSYTDNGEEYVENQAVNLDYSKLK